ncbi:MAG: WYL domain-containing protein [Candidatus Eremiobacteraeota bacterium]|nr:WYL domain-containing protein [Candidatus Eremiobacteraeota bacterium]
MKKKGGSPSTRFLALVQELEVERKITKARAQELYRNLATATWKRVKQELKALGCQLDWNAKAQTFYVRDWRWTIAPIPRFMRDPRLRARLAAVRAANRALGPPYADALGAKLRLWDLQLAEVDPEAAATMPSHRPIPRADKAFYARLNDVESGLRDHRLLLFSYRKTRDAKKSERIVEPYALHDHLGRFYIWGRETSKGPAKFFALDLVDDLTLGDEFDPDPRISIEDALAHTFGTFARLNSNLQRVIVEVDADCAAYVRARKWPAEAALAQLSNGCLRIEFEVSDPQELVFWVLSFAGSARIIQPAAAAELVRRAAVEIQHRHEWAATAPHDDAMLPFNWGDA